MYGWSPRTRRGRALRLWGPVAVIAVLSALAAFVCWTVINRRETPIERIGRVAGMGELDTAERLSWQFLQSHPGDLRTWIRFIDAYAELQHQGHDESLDGQDPVSTTPVSATSMSDAAVRRLLGRIPNADVATLATYWYETQTAAPPPAPTAATDTGTTETAATETAVAAAKGAAAPAASKAAAAVTALADARQPARYANYLLGRTAMLQKDWAAAARRFEREGLAFPKEGTNYLRRALTLWIDHDAWDEVRKRTHDPRYAAVTNAGSRLELAIHDRDWPAILLWLWPAGYVHVQAWPVALALLAAILWFFIASRLGRIHDSVPGRAQLYATAFVLGIFSIYPTLLVSIVEESLFGLKELNQTLPDAIYYVFGVGFREELCKLLLFLPLLPILKRRGSRIEAMTCGALVGLGFAAEENVGYFLRFNGSVAMTRFLTANFLHMSLTALVALSAFDASRGRSTSRDRFGIIFPLAVFIHGAYDFFLSSELSIFAMALFVIISRQFLRQLLIASSREEEQGILRLLVSSLALITGVSYVYATTLAGPWVALHMIALGFVGVAIVMYMFVRELSPS